MKALTAVAGLAMLPIFSASSAAREVRAQFGIRLVIEAPCLAPTGQELPKAVPSPADALRLASRARATAALENLMAQHDPADVRFWLVSDRRTLTPLMRINKCTGQLADLSTDQSIIGSE